MFAIAFDLTVKDTIEHHPKGVTQAYLDIETTLGKYDFERKQGSLYTCQKEDLSNLFSAMNALKDLKWFSKCVKDIRAFKIEQWSNFNDFFQK